MPAADPIQLGGAVAELAHEAACDLGLKPKAAKQLAPLLAASDFAQRVLGAHPEWIKPLLARRPLPVAQEQDFATRLAAQQRARALSVMAADILDGASEVQVCSAMSALAREQIDAALGQAERELAARRPKSAAAVRLCVFGMGKLGGGELNFSSDLDLVMAHQQLPEDDALEDCQEYFSRLTRRCSQLLGETTPEGQAWRIDLRLRPFGQAGQLALSFDAMEHYFQREGRDWERYAWIKASPVAGDVQGGLDFLTILRPFIYRRYLDYAAFEGLREMKQLIDAEVGRRGLEENLKLGPGGIREIEFMVQLEQLIRGGRIPTLRACGTWPALQAFADAGLWSREKLSELRTCYSHLRRMENRAQMFDNQQTHELPESELARERIAQTAGYANYAALTAALADTRDLVQRWFQAAVLPAKPSAARDSDGDQQAREVWRTLQEHDASTQAPAGVTPQLWNKLRDFADSPQVRSLSARSRARLDLVVPQLWVLARVTPDPDATAERLLEFLQAVLRRSSYLSLLAEQPASARWLVRLFSTSAWAAQRICQTPILLDELIDGRVLTEPVTIEGLRRAWQLQYPNVMQEDGEQVIEALRQFQQAAMLRLAVQLLFAEADPVAVARGLAWIADFVLDQALAVAVREIRAQHGYLPSAPEGTQPDLGFAVLGYGSLGGRELNFASDMDLVFIYDDSLVEQESAGRRPLDGHRYFVRLAQRLLHLLTFATHSGALYAVDTRLRPDGGKGLLVSAMDRFARYQTDEAWTWEHQALVRARWVAGDRELGRAFEALRTEIIAMPRVPEKLNKVSDEMRQRMRRELDRSDAQHFDLKQGAGGLVDIEFALQRQVLCTSNTGEPAATETTLLIQALSDRALSSLLAKAHHRWLALGLAATLAGRRRLAVLEADDRLLAEQTAAALAASIKVAPLR